MTIVYTKPSISQLELEYAADAVENGWGNKCYDYIERFENDFARYVGARYAVATSSCTGALTLGLSALGITHGDEIILADTNWIASAAPIVHAGATPVFVDILADTWCIDPAKAERAINKRTKAIIATHLYGNLCDMDALADICSRYGVALIEDAAEAIGSIYKGKRAGSLGTFSVFSFHGTKTLTTGEGGMFLTNDRDIYQMVTMLNNHGRKPGQPKQFWADVTGFKFKLSNVQAAIGCAQLERIDSLVARKRDILQRYREILLTRPGISMNPEIPETYISAWMPTVVISENMGITRELLQYNFNNKKIDARVFFWPLSALPMFREVRENQNSWSIPERAMNLPSFHDITDDQIQQVSDVILNILRDVGHDRN